jgi:hypothetical protein
MDTQYPSPFSASSTTLQSPAQSNSIASPLSDDDEFIIAQTTTAENCPMGQIENYEPEYWSTICYYELNSRVGEAFPVKFMAAKA